MNMKTKKEIRRKLLEVRNRIPEEILIETSRIILEKVSSLVVWKQAEIIYAYMDAKKEIMTRDLIELAWEQGKKVAVPRVDGNEMHFYYIDDFRQCESGTFGIMEPKKEECLLADDSVAASNQILMIVPGVAFDKTGNRIGYGKGYYDRYLQTHPPYTTVAIGGSWQMVEEIPSEETDVRMDYVISELGYVISEPGYVK